MLSLSSVGNIVFATNLENGKSIVEQNCQGCHNTGLLNSPKIGDEKEWAKRFKQGYKTLVDHAVKGFNSMPAKGGRMDLKNSDIGDAVTVLLKSAGINVVKNMDTPDSPIKTTVKKSLPQKKEAKKVSKNKPAEKANRFNRLMKPKAEWNQPPDKDGIHDSENEGTYLLQPPKEAFADLVKSPSGNRINWVKSLNDGLVKPRFDINDPTKEPFVMDLDIVREVKGSMPDVVYPHKQHTQWLDCSNCHPAIFIPKKGANQISMASILMGEQCGVCHGKVAFPVSECRLCHSKNKTKKSN